VNHLAHLFLAAPGAESLVGNLSGDFVKGALGERFTPGIRAGIRQHREIDTFTDTHPEGAAFRRVLTPEYGHYAGVIADMFFDHFLARRFDDFAGESLDAFLARTYAAIDPYADVLPGRLRELYPHIRDEHWLQSYRDVESIHFALRNLARRFSRQPDLAPATHHLVDSRAVLEGHFEALFRDAMAFSRIRFAS
jgi:acyl carrier protein phosphodiesterase